MRGKGRSHDERSQEEDDHGGVRKVGGGGGRGGRGGTGSSDVTGEVDGVSVPQPAEEADGERQEFSQCLSACCCLKDELPE